MITPEQQPFIFQLNSLFAQLENTFTSNYLDEFHNSWIRIYRHYRDQTQDEQQMRSMERRQLFNQAQKMRTL